MRFFVSNNAKFSKLGRVTIIGNTQNGGFIGLNADGSKLFDMISAGVEFDIEDLTSEQVKLLEAAIKLDILSNVKNADFAKSDEIHSAYLHITNRCNLHCMGCYSNNRERNVCEDLSLQHITKILDELKDIGLETLCISGGEPFLRPDLDQIVIYAKNIGIENVMITSNATCIDISMLTNIKKLVTCIAISIDGFNTENQQFIRDSGTFQKVITTSREMKRCGIPMKFVATIHRKNYKYITNYIGLSREMGIPISFSILTCNPKIEPLNELVLNNEEFSALLSMSDESTAVFDDTPSAISALRYKSSCGAGENLISIDALGNVFPCHMLHYDEFKLGNVLETPLFSIISSEAAKKFRSITVDSYDECSQCNYRYFCGAGCKARRYLHEGSPLGKDIYCMSYWSNLEQFSKHLESFYTVFE